MTITPLTALHGSPQCENHVVCLGPVLQGCTVTVIDFLEHCAAGKTSLISWVFT